MTLLLRLYVPAALLLALLAGPGWAADAAAGKASYDILCTACHGATGKGDGPAGGALNPAPRDFSVGDFKFDADKNGTPGEDIDLKLVIKDGAAAYGGNPSMAPWAILSDEDLDNMVAYVRSLKE
ncbi:MAG: hypothetical protein CL910_21070 [Deltaproteobacteria bacterium]|jgi:mono/diheme cytochrome c family protein|nr:hypothetical protein [Deltaproteobacteria bacterium]